jgi:serine/threonine protein kinase
LITLYELTKLVKDAKTLNEVFPTDIHTDFQKYMHIAHPDKGGDNAVYSVLVEWHSEHRTNPDWRTVRVNSHSLEGMKVRFSYGDEEIGVKVKESQVYNYFLNSSGVYIAIPKHPSSNDLAERDVKSLAKIHAFTDSSNVEFVSIMKNYFPVVKGMTNIKSGSFSYKVFSFTHPKGEPYSISEIVKKYPKGIDVDHVSWIFRRYLVCLQYLTMVGVKHNAITPDNLWIDDINHGVVLTNFSNSGSTPPYVIASPYNQDDLSSLITCMVMLQSGQTDLDHSGFPDNRKRLLNRALENPYKYTPFELHEEYGSLLGTKTFKELKI